MARPMSPLREALLAFAVAAVGTVAFAQAGRVIPFVGKNLQAFVAAIFLYLPFWISGRRGEDLSAYGFTWRPLGRSLAFGLGGPAIVFPLFAVGFALFYRQVCAPGAPAFLAALAPPRWCLGFRGLGALAHPRLPGGFLESAFANVVVVAIPEELFFRGYLLARLEKAFPPRHRVLGGGVGVALVISAALFAVGHLFVGFDPRRLAVFFPGLLFGWMRSATGSIAAGSMVHAGANLTIDLLRRTFFV